MARSPTVAMMAGLVCGQGSAGGLDRAQPLATSLILLRKLLASSELGNEKTDLSGRFSCMYPYYLLLATCFLIDGINFKAHIRLAVSVSLVIARLRLVAYDHDLIKLA